MHRDLHAEWSDMAPCDAHMHLYAGKTFEWNLDSVNGYMGWYGVERAALLALPAETGDWWRDDGSNLRCLGVKAVLNAKNPAKRVYALAGLQLGDGATTGPAEGLADQARRALAMGFDGFKSLIGKPGLRKRVGIPLDDPVFDPFFDVMEQSGKPFIMHIGDPAIFWDLENAPESAKRNGWTYDSSFPTLEQVWTESENILRKHPGLKTTFAHAYFKSEDPDDVERLLSTYPNLGLDMAPGWEMHIGFTRFHDRWHDLFERFRNRFYFATDTCNSFGDPFMCPQSDEGWSASSDLSAYEGKFNWAYDQTRNALELKGGEFEVNADDVLHHFRPLDLSDEAREAVMRGNFIRRFGAEPAPIDRDLAQDETRRLLAMLEKGIPEGTSPAAHEASLAIARRWAAAPVWPC